MEEGGPHRGSSITNTQETCHAVIELEPGSPPSEQAGKWKQSGVRVCYQLYLSCPLPRLLPRRQLPRCPRLPDERVSTGQRQCCLWLAIRPLTSWMAMARRCRGPTLSEQVLSPADTESEKMVCWRPRSSRWLMVFSAL